MIQLLFSLLVLEVCVVFVLLFKTPLRKLAIAALDRLKRGRAPIMVKTVAGTVLVVLTSSVHSMVKIRTRSSEIGSLTPTDQVLMSRHLLEASLMAYSLFLALIIDRLHHYVRELRGTRKNMEAVMKHNRALEEANAGRTETQEKVASELKAKIKQLEFESESGVKAAKAAEASITALKKQCEGLLLEYDRLQEENQDIRNQLRSVDCMLSQTEGKKNT